MELREAVAKVNMDAALAMKVTAAEDDPELRFKMVSHEEIVDTLVVDFATRMGARLGKKLWPQIEPDPSSLFEKMSEPFADVTLKGCWSWFAIGWVLGSPENQVKPKTKKTFVEALKAVPRDELRLLENRFATEDFLKERFLVVMMESGCLVSQIFNDRGTPITEESLKTWCAMAASPPLFAAYELGTKSRTLIEEDITLSEIEKSLDN